MDVRKVQDVRKNVEHQYIAEDSKLRVFSCIKILFFFHCIQ